MYQLRFHFDEKRFFWWLCSDELSCKAILQTLLFNDRDSMFFSLKKDCLNKEDYLINKDHVMMISYAKISEPSNHVPQAKDDQADQADCNVAN